MGDNTIAVALENACKILKGNMSSFQNEVWGPVSQKNFYTPSENTDWTTGFCTGEYWLAYENSGDESFKLVALNQVESFLHRIKNHINTDHHDMGFLYSLSCVSAYKLTGNENAKTAALLAADSLMKRFQEVGQFFQAWGELGAKDNYRLIIDCLLNLPLLYWASEITGNDDYRQKAISHTKTSIANLVREDNSTYHTFFFDDKTGEPIKGATQQGYRDNSAWARGQAWGIYGLALSYRYTKDKACIGLFKRVADFFISHLPQDYVPYWDLCFTSGEEPRDSSAAAIAACGMLEMTKYLPEAEARYYTELAKKLTDALIKECSVSDSSISNGLLLHGVYAKNSLYNPIPVDNGVDECNTWGDYFYLELLTRQHKNWEMYW